MLNQASLRRLVVIRRDHEQSVCASGLGLAREFESVRGVVGAHTGYHGGPIADCFNHGTNQGRLFGISGRGCFAGSAVDDQTVLALIDQPRRQRLSSVEVHGALGIKGRDHRGQQTTKRRVGSGV